MTTSGAILVDKPMGWTSHDVVGKLRGVLRTRRIGHAGTLDPMATGLLVVAVGPATRLLRFAQEGMKTYEGVVRLGVATDSLDADGDVVAEQPVPQLALKHVQGAASLLTGSSLQVPPMVSAIKIGGKKLYELAREGLEVERPARPIQVERFSITRRVGDDSWAFVVTVSPGTYVRVLAADLAHALGTVGHLSALRRVQSGSHHVDQAHSIDAIVAAGEEATLLAPARSLVGHLPTIAITDDQAVAVRQGKLLDVATGDESYAAAIDVRGDLVAVMRRRGENWQPDVVLPADESESEK